MKSTNYYNTFIEVAEDCPVETAEVPPERRRKTVVRSQYEMIANHPYEFTSDDVIFGVYAEKHKVPQEKRAKKRDRFFSKGRACLRSSALGKRYGWGIHHNAEGKVAIYSVGSGEYESLANDESLTHLKAMRSGRK